MREEIQECRALIEDALLLINRLRESPTCTEERMVEKIGSMMVDKDPHAMAMVSVVAMLMLAEERES